MTKVDDRIDQRRRAYRRTLIAALWIAVIGGILYGFIWQRPSASVHMTAHSPQSPLPASKPDALHLLLQTQNVAGPQPYVRPSDNAGKWDFGGGANTAQNWVNWTSISPGNTEIANGWKLNTSLPPDYVVATDIVPSVGMATQPATKP
jgi:hypothetical protein